jgi:hypothetical protein
VRCAHAFLEFCSGKETKIIDSIVTGDEAMVLYYEQTGIYGLAL